MNLKHRERFGLLDYLKLELATQAQRLKFAWAVTRGKTYCDFPPRKVAIEASSGCNLRCIHCGHGEPGDGRPDRMTRPKQMLAFDLYKKVIDECALFFPKPKIIFALMGEPLLNKQLPEMVAYAHDRGLWIQVNTNSTMLTAECGEALIDAGVDMVYLSFDGVTKETYERIRVRSNFERVLGNILDFLELKYRKNADGLIIHIGMTGEIINQHELDVFVREFSKLPANAVYSPLLFNWVGEIGWAGESLKELQTPDRTKWPVCNTSYDIVGIQSNGNFIPCIYDFNSKYVSGNVRFQTMQELWNHERTQRFRRAVQTRDYGLIEENGPMCSQCTILWNPRYNVEPGLADNLGTIGQYTLNAFKDFVNTPVRRAHLREKYQYLRDHRQEWLDSLALQAAPEQGEMINIVREKGFLQIRA